MYTNSTHEGHAKISRLFRSEEAETPRITNAGFRVPEIQEQIRELKDELQWTPSEQTALQDFADGLVSDIPRLVSMYFRLVEQLAPQSMAWGLKTQEIGKLVSLVDPSAFDRVPLGEALDPVEFAQKRIRNQKYVQKLNGWVRDVPLRLHAIKEQIIQTPSATVFNFPKALLETKAMIDFLLEHKLVREIMQKANKSISVPNGIDAVCNAIRLGKTSITRVDPPGLVAFYWPISDDDFRDRLTSKEAGAFLRKLGKPVKTRTLYNRAVDRPSLKQGSKYLKSELEKAVDEGVFDHGWKAP
ncbi:MAG: hypothetical protein FJ167_10415 [Gammaproteobacteria bacterium]|nr:hypothetical protein [Gammaproteobacteria bacterium]